MDIIGHQLPNTRVRGQRHYHSHAISATSPPASLKRSHLLLKLGRIYCCFLNAGNNIKENPKAVADYKAWKEKALNSLVGAVMKKMKGGADARTVFPVSNPSR
ncbi:MAG: hypothetical protein PHH85_07965 [Candidatus Methanoperedens sp.]|nr:hypothetical protein [Candidatus Methanoperedens sp.]